MLTHFRVPFCDFLVAMASRSNTPKAHNGAGSRRHDSSKLRKQGPKLGGKTGSLKVGLDSRMTASADHDNPITKFMLERIEDFSAECKRLRDKSPLIEYKALIDRFRLIVTKLGGLEHEVALAALNEEFRAASCESRDAWRGIWRKFREHRQRARILDEEYKARQREGAQLLADLEKSCEKLNDDFPEQNVSFRSCIDAAKAADDLDLNMGSMWRSGSWQFLLIDLYAFSVYVRYHFAKATFFLFRHSFIAVTSIVIFGFGMSFVMRGTSNTLSELHPQWPWLGAAVAVFGYWMKKYYIDPKIRKLQTKLETRRLSPLAFHLHLARTMALYSRTASRG